MSDASAGRVLDAAIKALRTEIFPQLPDDAIRIRFDQITRLLTSVSARISRREKGLLQLLQSAAGSTDIPPVAAPSADQTLEELEQQRVSVERAISQRLPALLDSAAQSKDAIQALERIVELEKAFYISQDADIAAGSAVVYRGGRIESEPPAAPRRWPEIDAESLTVYLRTRFNRADIAATKVRPIAGGFSKETIFFTLVDERSGTDRNLVIRKDMPVPFINKSVVNEFPLLEQLHKRGFPVAEPLWLETNRDLFGGRFIVSARVAGTSDVASWAAEPTRARQACRELAQVLGRLHAYDPAQLGYPPELVARSAGDLVERDIEAWLALFNERKAEPFPLQELPLVWLRRNIPRQLYSRPAKIVHGDVGFHNLMFDENGHITALLDWEFSVLGDPMQDIRFVRQFVERIMDWQEFLAIYREAGGVEPCPEAEFFFDLWSKTRNGIGCVDAQSLFDTAMPEEVKFALAGYVFGPYMYLECCEVLLAHLKKSG